MSLFLRNAGIQIDGRSLIRDVSLSVESERVTAVVGPNGSGKSTVLRLLAGLWEPTEGLAELNGENLARLPRLAVAREVTFVPQDTRVDFAFTVRDVVAMGRYPHVGRFDSLGAADVDAVNAALERADVAHLEERFANELSGGERQRVLIARSLATEAKAILLDEPTANLDIDHSLETLELLQELADEGKAVAVALHDLNAVMRWADQVALMNGGRLEAFGAVGDVVRDDLIEPVFGVNVEHLRTAGGNETLVFHRLPTRSDCGSHVSGLGDGRRRGGDKRYIGGQDGAEQS